MRNLTKEEIEEAYEKNTGVLIADEFEAKKKDYSAVPAVLCKNPVSYTHLTSLDVWEHLK